MSQSEGWAQLGGNQRERFRDLCLLGLIKCAKFSQPHLLCKLLIILKYVLVALVASCINDFKTEESLHQRGYLLSVNPINDISVLAMSAIKLFCE